MPSSELAEIAFQRRIKATDGNRIAWASDQEAKIKDFVFSRPESILRASIAPPAVNIPAIETSRLKMEIAGIVKSGPGDGSLRWVVRISDECVDLSGDVVKQSGWDFSGYRSNPVIFNSHDSSSPPIASSTQPWFSGSATFAIGSFPEPGVSPVSDQIRGLIAAGILKGASVGFKPTKFEFSKDPARPLGVNFLQQRLLEWSYCGLPCCPTCLVVGPASDYPKAAPRQPAPSKTRSERLDEVAIIKREIARL